MKKSRSLLKHSVAFGIAVLINSAVIFLISSAKTKYNSKLPIKEEIVSNFLLNKIIKAIKWQPPSSISFLQDKEIVVDGRYKQGDLRALLILSPRKQGRILWLNSNIDWVACSPHGKYIAYPGPEDIGGVWLLDLKTHTAKLLAPEVLRGKVLSGFVHRFLDERHFVIERVDEELLKKGEKLDVSIDLRCLSQREVERYFELLSLFFAGKLKPEEEQELHRLETKVLKQISKEDLQKLKDYVKYLDQIAASKEIRLVDIQTGKEKLLAKGGTVIGIKEDKKGVYVLDNMDHKVFKVDIDNPPQKEELFYKGSFDLRIRKERPLRYGFVYPPLSFAGLYYPLYPPSTYKCYCYEKKNSEIRLLKTINCGDGRFPNDSRLSLSPQGHFSIAYGPKGLFLKDLSNGKIKKITDKSISIVEWSEDDKMLLYISKGKKCYEIWLFETSSLMNLKMFPP
ncbi:hypothetical protein H5T88_05140 [bacterium]|nr:hypothetical protein [bacterium]